MQIYAKISTYENYPLRYHSLLDQLQLTSLFPGYVHEPNLHTLTNKLIFLLTPLIKSVFVLDPPISITH